MCGKVISHRGNTNGPNQSLENNPFHILSLLNHDIDCEIDVWNMDGDWFTGHDAPLYKTTLDFLKKPGLWIHCKNFSALELLNNESKINYFWHENDKYTITSFGCIWAYPGVEPPENGVIVHLGSDWCGKYKKSSVCTDFFNKNL